MRQEYLQDIFYSLKFIGIGWNEGPEDVQDFGKTFSQIHRMPLYHEALNELRRLKKVFACVCSRTTLENGCHCREKNILLDEKEVAWRLDTSDDHTLKITVLGKPAVQTKLPGSMKDFIVRKKDGFPSYQLTSLIDDLHFEVDLIVRGADLWESTLAQMYLARVLDKDRFCESTFVHHELVKGRNGQKLSKSAGDSSLRRIKAENISREEVINASNLLSRGLF